MSDFKEKIVAKLQDSAKKIASERELHLLRIDVRGSERNPVIEVIIDGARPITIEDCSSVSRQLNTLIEEGSLLNANQRLDVMSPGIDEPLVHSWQFERAKGRLVEAEYEIDGDIATARGTLKAWNDETVMLQPSPKKGKHAAETLEAIEIARSEVKQLRTVIDFSRK